MSFKIGQTWTDLDFEKLGWNSCRLYGLILPGRCHELKFFIDYALRNPISDPKFGKWELIPVELTFLDVFDLKVDLNTENFSEVDIISVERHNKRPTPNGNKIYWDYKIELSPYSLISFTSTSFKQISTADAVVSKSFDLDRELEF